MAHARSFRTAYKHDLTWRVVDAAAHAVAAIVVPDHWWLQYLPDVLVVPLWLSGMISNHFADPHSPLLRVHQLLHGRPRWLSAALWVAVALVLENEYVVLHVAVHLAIDAATHTGGWQ